MITKGKFNRIRYSSSPRKYLKSSWSDIFVVVVIVGFSRQGFSVVLEPVLEIALVGLTMFKSKALLTKV